MSKRRENDLSEVKAEVNLGLTVEESVRHSWLQHWGSRCLLGALGTGDALTVFGC